LEEKGFLEGRKKVLSILNPLDPHTETRPNLKFAAKPNISPTSASMVRISPESPYEIALQSHIFKMEGEYPEGKKKKKKKMEAKEQNLREKGKGKL